MLKSEQELVISKNINGQLLFSAYNKVSGFEWWTSDGTSAGTKLLRDIGPGELNGINYINTAQLGNYLYFEANDGVHGKQLWRTDGTTEGTILFKKLW